MAAVSLDADGQVLALTPLTAASGAAALKLESAVEPAGVELLGFPRFEGDTPLPEAPLTVLEGCGPKLPFPNWRAQLRGPTPAQDAPLRNLTVDFGTRVCQPGFAAAFTVDPRCVPRTCTPVVLEEHGCEALIGLPDCGRVQLRVRPTFHAPCVEVLEQSCTTVTSSGGLTTELACGDCGYVVHAESQADFATVERVQVLDVSPRAASQNELDKPRNFLRRTGYLTGMAVVDDTVVVLSRAGEYQDAQVCINAPARFELFDLALNRVRTATAPSCARGPVAWNGRFVATYVENSSVAVGRFALDGRLEARVLLDTPPPARAIVASGPLSQAGEVIVAITEVHDLVKDAHAVIWAIEPSSMRARPLADVAGEVYAMTLDGPVLVIAQNGPDALLRLDPATGALEGQASVSSMTSITVADVLGHAGTGRVFVSVTSEESTVRAFNGITELDNASLLEADTRPLTTLPWPDPRMIAIASMEAGNTAHPYAAGLHRLEPVHIVTEPGRQLLGYGPLSEGVVVGSRLYATLPWAGQLLRITPQ